MADDIKRLHYFERQFLHAQDFNDEQAYHLALHRDHARLLHSPGIADGLDIREPTATDTAVTVTPGTAYDKDGQRIVLVAEWPIELSGFAPDQAVYITIEYDESQTDHSDEGGESGNTRWIESPKPVASESAPVAPTETLVLARIERNGTTVAGVDRSGRLTAGIRGDVQGNLNVRGNLDVAGTIRGDIAVGTVEPGDLAKAAVTSEAIANDAVTSAKIAEAVESATPIPGRGEQDTDSGTGIKTGHIQNRAITTQKLADAAVTADQLADGAVTAAKLAEDALDSVKIGDGDVGTVAIADDAVISVKIAEADNVSGRLRQDTNSGRGIKTGHIQDEAVTTAKLANGAVTASKLADRTIDGTKMAENLEIQGRVGIGLSPAFPLDVRGRMRIRQTSSAEETAGVWLSGYYRRELDAAFVGMQKELAIGVYSNVGEPDWRLTVTLDRGDLSITGNAFKPGGGAWGTRSDERLKQEIKPLDNALERLLQLRPITFAWKKPAEEGNLTGPQMGFLANEVETVFPDWVGVDPDGYKTLTIRGFEALAVEALKELRSENEQLRAALAEMQEKIDGLERRRRR